MAPAQRCRQAVAAATVRIVAAQAQVRCQSREHPHPGAREGQFARRRGSYSQATSACRGTSPSDRREAVRSDVDHPPARCDEACDLGLDRLAMGPVVRSTRLCPARPRQRARDFREQLPMADRTVQVDQQSRRGRGVQRQAERVGHLTSEFQRAGVPAAVAAEQGFPAGEERGIGVRDLASTVLAGDDELIAAWVGQRSSSRRTGRTSVI